MMHLTIGGGQIGTAISSILSSDIHDPYKGVYGTGHYDMLHICIPYDQWFKEAVKGYIEEFRPSLTVIHSTVPVGTSEELGTIASPCRGVHPKLEEGIRTFVKFFGGPNSILAGDVFYSLGIDTVCIEDSRSVEAMKLWDTTIYGLNIMLEKEIYRYCQDHGLDFDVVYKWANTTYNDGYEKLGRPEYKKYILEHKEGPLGGHCVIPNLDMLDSWVSNLIKLKNDGLKTG
jgi:hypothetical protein